MILQASLIPLRYAPVTVCGCCLLVAWGEGGRERCAPLSSMIHI